MNAFEFIWLKKKVFPRFHCSLTTKFGFWCCCLLFGSQLEASASYPALYGNGFDSLRLEHKPQTCIQGRKIEEHVTNVHSYFNKVKSWSSLQTELDFGMPGAVYFKSGGELAKFVLKARDNRFTSTYILRNRIVIKRDILTEPEITFQGDDDDFRGNCGNKYISLVENGGELFVGIKLYFSHAEYKDQFEIGGNIETITSLNSRIASLHEDVKTDAAVEVFFNQIGGDLSKLNELFESGDIVDCSLDKFDKCRKIITGIWNYSNDQFPKAVESGKSQTIGFRAANYPGRRPLYENRRVLEKRRELLEVLEKHIEDRNEIEVMKLIGSAAKDCDHYCLSLLIGKISSNIASLKRSVGTSFQDGQRFLARATLNDLKLHEYELPERKQHQLNSGYQLRPILFGGIIIAGSWVWLKLLKPYLGFLTQR